MIDDEKHDTKIRRCIRIMKDDVKDAKSNNGKKKSLELSFNVYSSV